MNHLKVYMDMMGYDSSDFVPCEVCGKKAVDIHHIEPRGMGGSKQKDNIENLMALCRACHIRYGDKTVWKDYLKKKHRSFI